jgi:hypothetical protein
VTTAGYVTGGARWRLPHEAATTKTLIFATDCHQATDDKNKDMNMINDDHGESDGIDIVTATIIPGTIHAQNQSARHTALCCVNASSVYFGDHLCVRSGLVAFT